MAYLSKDTSTLGYLSNIQIIDKSISNDTKYMANVHDPFSLGLMKKLIEMGCINYKMTNLQCREMKAASGHCTFAFKDDYPWGTIYVDGEKKVVCKCINRECALFQECRKGLSVFNEEELTTDDISVMHKNIENDFFSRAQVLGIKFKERLTGNSYEIIEEKESHRKKDYGMSISGQEFMSKPVLNVVEIEITDTAMEKEQSLAVKKGYSISEAKLIDADKVLSDFQSWLLENDYKTSIASGYVCAVKSANKFAKNKDIWDEDIYTVSTEEGVLEYIEMFEKSIFFKTTLSNYVIALRCFANFCAVKNTDAMRMHINKVEENTTINTFEDVEINQDDYRSINSFFNGGFTKFVETEQDTVIFADPSERIIVNAGPGTGKTYTLIEKLIFMVNDQEVDPEEILVLCFSRAAVEIVEKRLKSAYESGFIGMNWNSIDIRTFDSFATHLLSYVVENERTLLYDGFSLEQLDYDGRISVASNIIKNSKELIEQCSHLIVDEVQDLVSFRAEFVKKIVENLPEDSGYTLFGDSCQAIYDYQIKEGEIDSIEFYSWLFKTQNSAKFWSFGINYRQASELEELGNRYRDAILNGTDDDRNEVAKNVLENIEILSEIDLCNVEFRDFMKIVGNNSLGILTRTNGQALKISTWFRNSGIPHRVQKRLTDNTLNIWIADVFRDYENDTIDQDTFVELFSRKGDISFKPREIWNAIERTQPQAKDRYYVRDILYGLLNSRNREFYSFSEEEQIMISNIHRSKGREFETVILLDDTLYMENQEAKDLLEHKVSYVAVTRAKEKIYRTNIGSQYIKTDKKGDRRAYAIGRNFVKKKPYLSHVEIGRNWDLDAISFVERNDIQVRFDDPLSLIGERVILIKNNENSSSLGYVCYDIFLDDDRIAGIIGRTSKKFYMDLKNILKEIHNLSSYIDVYPELYPNRFSEIYVDDVITVIGSVSPNAIAVKRYNDLMVWKGITLVGFAQVERDSY